MDRRAEEEMAYARSCGRKGVFWIPSFADYRLKRMLRPLSAVRTPENGSEWIPRARLRIGDDRWMLGRALEGGGGSADGVEDGVMGVSVIAGKQTPLQSRSTLRR